MGEDIQNELKQLEFVYNTIINFFVNYSFQLLGAMLVFLIGLFVARKVSNAVLRLCERKALDITLSRFVANVVRVIVIIMVAIICLNKIGISITPFIAAIGAASLGAGLAVQGLLSNYGAGFNIIITRPFVVGDTISVQGVSGLVRDIYLAYTVLVTEDDVEITIPNKHIVGEILHNSHSVTLVELAVGVSYGSDLDKVTGLLQSAVAGHSLSNDTKAPQVGIANFGDSGVDIEIRFWADTDKINAAKFALNKVVWDTLKANSIDIPFPQREVRMLAS